MANRYWVGASGDWTNTARWSTTSGGAGGSAVPTSADDVFLDSNYTVTLVGTSVAKTITHTNGTFNTAGYELTTNSLASTGSTSRTINLSTSRIILAGPTGTTLNLVSTGLNFIEGTSYIEIRCITGTTTINTGNVYFNSLKIIPNYTGTGGNIININGSSFYNNLSIISGGTGSHAVTFQTGQTSTVRNLVFMGSTSGSRMSMNSTAASHTIDIYSGGSVSGSWVTMGAYLICKYIGGTGWAYDYIGSNSVDTTGTWTVADVPLMSTLIDDFTGTTINSTTWQYGAYGTGSVTQNNKMIFTWSGGSTTGYYFNSKGSFDLTDNYVSYYNENAGTTETVYLSLFTSDRRSYSYTFNTTVGGSNISLEGSGGGGSVTPSPLTFGVPYWVKISHSGTSLTLSTSLDNVSWTNHGSLTLNTDELVWLKNTKFQMNASRNVGSGDFIMDKLNVLPPNGAGISGDAILSATGAVIKYGDATLDGDSLISATGASVAYGSASIGGEASMYADRILMVGTSSILADGVVDLQSFTKTYLYKVYDNEWNFLGTWNDVVSEFGYSQEINSAGAAIDVTLARNSDSRSANYDSIANDSDVPIITDDNNEIAAEIATLAAIGPGTTVDLNLNVKIFEFSASTTSIEGDIVFTGYISKYTSKYGSTETTQVSLFSYGADLDNWLLTDTDGNTRVSYLSIDPANILKTTLDKFVLEGGLITYAPDVVTARTNRVLNPSVETNSTGWAGYQATIARSTTKAKIGTYSIQATVTAISPDSPVVTYAVTGLSVGQTYTFGFYINPSAQRICFINSPQMSDSYTQNVVPANTWQWITSSGVATATSGTIEVGIFGASIGELFYVDGALLEHSTVTGTYFDGATTDNALNTYSWDTTAHASESYHNEIIEPETISDTSTIVTYAFNLNTGLEVIKKSLELAPTDWYFYTDLATNLLHFHPRPTVPAHYFFLGKHILSLDLERSMEGITNDLVLTGGKPTNVVTDNFFGSNGTTLESHTGELGATWTKHASETSGSAVIDTNRIRSNSTSAVTYLASGVINATDYSVEADLRVLSFTSDFGLLGRIDTSALTYYMVKLSSAGTDIELYKRVAGTFTLLKSTAYPFATSNTYNVELKMEGSRISVKVGNSTPIDVMDTSIPYGTRAGIRFNTYNNTSSTGVHFNNFKVAQIGNTGTSIFKRYIDTASITAYRRGLARIQDNRISVEESADIIALSQIERQNEPRYRSQITISNGAYNIRSIKLGQLIGFRNFGNYVDSVTMQIVRIDYQPDQVTLQLDTLLPSVPKRLEDIKRNLNQSDVEDNPDAPELAP